MDQLLRMWPPKWEIQTEFLIPVLGTGEATGVAGIWGCESAGGKNVFRLCVSLPISAFPKNKQKRMNGYSNK